MGDANPIRTLGDYSRPSHEGYRNTIELPEGNNVVPLRSDTIRLVQNGCSFHGLRSEDPNQHLKDFLKLVDSLDLDVANRERTRLRLFQFSLRDQASNWLERLPAGSISTWEDLTTRFLAQFFPPGRTAKLRNDILMFQQHQGESLSEAWTRFKDLLQKVPHHGIDLWLQVQIFYDHVNPATRRTIDQSAGGKLRDRNAKESWALLEDLALYDNKSWNDPRDFAKPVKAISLPQDVPSTSDRRLIELEHQVQRLMEAYIAPMQPTQVNKITSSCEICSGPHDTQYCMENPEQAFVEYASSRTDEAGGKDLMTGDVEKSTEKGSDNTDEATNVLSTLEAANVLSSGSFPTVAPAGVATASGSFPTAAIFTTTSVTTPYTRRTRASREIIIEPSHTNSIPTISAKGKGKEKMVESTSTKKKKIQEQLDAQVAKEAQVENELRMMIVELDRSNELIAKYMTEYEQAEADLSLEEKMELITELIKYQRNLAKIKKYQA
ncbi:MAK10-like protein [Tanacetum coccineum]